MINLPNGKSIEMSLEVYLRMTDDDYEYLLSVNWGDDVLNPFAGSVLLYGESTEKFVDEEDDDEENIEEMSDLDKLQDIDAEDMN